MLFDFIVKKLENSEAPQYLEVLVSKFMIEVENIILDSTEYDESFSRYIRKGKKKIKLINKRILDEGWKDEVISFISKDESAIKRGPNFSLLLTSENYLYENPNKFSDRIGYQLLKYYKCKNEEIHITSNTLDGGIDFWGSYKFMYNNFELSEEVLIIGQVKMYSNTVSVKEIREFIGAVNVANESCYFGESHNSNSSQILLFVTTGELSKNALMAASKYKIKIISRRHLMKLSLMK